MKVPQTCEYIYEKLLNDLEDSILNDDKIIKLLKNNPSKGLSCAIDNYGPLVKTIALRILGYDNQQDLEECVSDVFVELWKSIKNYDENKGSLKNYIISIARFVSINTYNRKLIKEPLIPLEENEFELDTDLETETFKTINKEIIKETLNNMPHPDKEIFIRRYYLYESVKEIASYLNMNDKAVENRLYRGKEKLKAALINNGIIL